MGEVIFIREHVQQEEKTEEKSSYIKESIFMGLVLVAAVWVTNKMIGGKDE